MNGPFLAEYGLWLAELLVTCVALLAALHWKWRLGKGNAWTRAAHRLGMSVIEVRGRLLPDLHARLGGMHVRVSGGIGGGSWIGTRITVEAPDVLPEHLELRSESPQTAREKLLAGPDIEVGDPAFDDAVLVRGYPVLAVALLDVERRQRIIGAVSAGSSVRSRTVIRYLPHLIRRGEELKDVIDDMLDLVRALRMPRDLAGMLANNALHDPVAAVRRRNCQLLAERFANDPRTAEVLRQALADKALEVRLEAAIALGEEGHELLRELLDDPDTSDDVTALAMRALGPRLGQEQTLETLDQALRSRRRLVALTALEVLSQIGGRVAADRVRTVLGVADFELAVAAARALGKIADPADEPALIEALDHADIRVRDAALHALAKVGTKAAVRRLRRLILAHSGEPGLLPLALQAIAAIHSRLKGVAPGQLALANGEAGQLSLSGHEAGELSLAEADDLS